MDGQTLQHAGGVVEYPLATTRHRGYGEKDEGQYDEPADVPFVTGAALALRRNVLRDTGGFDAGFYPVYYEDTDLCYRARAAGWRVVYWPSAVALHRTSATLDQSSQAYFEFLHANRLRFILKHYTIQQIMNDVLPAEAARLRGEMPAADRLASRRACHALGDVHMPDYSELDHALDDLDKRRRLHERPFTSRAPLVGGLVARLRGAFNSIATRWYVLPIMEQQSAFNAGVVQTLRALARQADAQESVGAASQGILTKRLQALEERLERIEKHAPERSSGG
jgi:cellulose synthase/poly-beta-1,6-N-acetylglucosamine synthase-like glycosyltransferase